MLTSALRIMSTSLRKCSSRKARMRREIMASPTTAMVISPRSASYSMGISSHRPYCLWVRWTITYRITIASRRLKIQPMASRSGTGRDNKSPWLAHAFWYDEARIRPGGLSCGQSSEASKVIMQKALIFLTCWCLFVRVAAAQPSGCGSTPPPHSSPAEGLSVSAGALVWGRKDSPAPPPLVSTGVLGQPGTTVLVGGEDVNTHEQPGLRITAGYRVTERWGLEVSGFY